MAVVKQDDKNDISMEECNRKDCIMRMEIHANFRLLLVAHVGSQIELGTDTCDMNFAVEDLQIAIFQP